ncbi:MAG: PASTA domain-containing protein [Trueperaceae bacterium]
MAVLDSKYEILTQASLGDGQTLYEAVAPDGTALRVIWFDLATPQQETQFERYRQLLRKLEKQDLAAIFDIVSRPGAHYVVWYVPSSGKTKASPELAELLQRYGYPLGAADIRADRGKAVLYSLNFDKPIPEPQLPTTSPPPATRLFIPNWFSPRWLLAWLLGGALSILGMTAWTFGFLRRANDMIITIPDVRGQDVNEASEALHRLGLAVNLEPSPSNDTPGVVLSSEPAAGQVLRPRRTIHLQYALPSGQVALTTVPQLRGETLSSAIQTTLETAKLRLGNIAYLHANVQAGIILGQTHSANSQISEETPVGVLVSLGPKDIETFLPDLTGLPLETAYYFIELAGLPLPVTDYVTTTRQPNNTVLEQNIAPYTLVSRDETTVRLLVAGTNTASLAARGVPSLIGLSLEEAKRVASGYTLDIQDTSSPNLPRGVVDQIPAPGAESSIINLTVNHPPEPLPNPNAFARVQKPNERLVPYRFYIEAGIASSSASIRAETLQGDITVLRDQNVAGGQVLENSWKTKIPGPVTFILSLNGEIYDRQTRNP